MELTQGKSTPTAITVARHITGMAIVSLANPFIYYDQNPIEAWAITFIGAIIIASALLGVLALIQPQRVKTIFPMMPIKSAWLILALMLFSKWQDYRAIQPMPNPVVQSSPSNTFSFKEANPFSDPNFGKELLPK